MGQCTGKRGEVLWPPRLLTQNWAAGLLHTSAVSLRITWSGRAAKQNPARETRRWGVLGALLSLVVVWLLSLLVPVKD